MLVEISLRRSILDGRDGRRPRKVMRKNGSDENPEKAAATTAHTTMHSDASCDRWATTWTGDRSQKKAQANVSVMLLPHTHAHMHAQTRTQRHICTDMRTRCFTVVTANKLHHLSRSIFASRSATKLTRCMPYPWISNMHRASLILAFLRQ